MKRVVLIRHAEPGSDGSLSFQGKVVQRKAVLRLREEGISPNKIYTSPLLRAQETADILAEEFQVEVVERDALGDEFDANELLRIVDESEDSFTIFFVGHAPTLALFAEKLIGKNVLPLGIAKSGAVVIDFEGSMVFGEGLFVDYLVPN